MNASVKTPYKGKGMVHELVATPVDGGYMHGYFFAPRAQESVARAAFLNKMMDAVEELGLSQLMPMPVVMSTPLDNAATIERVQQIISSGDENARRLLAESKEFFHSAWIMDGASPINKELLGFH